VLVKRPFLIHRTPKGKGLRGIKPLTATCLCKFELAYWFP